MAAPQSSSAVRCGPILVDLFSAIDQDQAKHWAEVLTAEFDGFGKILDASDERVGSLISDARVRRLLGTIRTAMAEATIQAIEDRPVLAAAPAMIDYLHLTMAHRITECARVMHLNTRNVLIRDEQVSEGSVNNSVVHVREIARRALELGSAAVILIHNHPSGDPSPSPQDITLTRDLVLALKPLGIVVHDHWIVGATGQVSMRAQGLL